MGWLHGSEEGRGGTATCIHGAPASNCPLCKASSSAVDDIKRAEYTIRSAERRLELIAKAALLSRAAGIKEVEDYLDFEAGTMKWVPVDQFLKECPGAVVIDGKVRASVEHDFVLNWR